MPSFSAVLAEASFEARQFPGEAVEGHHSFPVTLKGFSSGLVATLVEPSEEAGLEMLGLVASLGVGYVA